MKVKTSIVRCGRTNSKEKDQENHQTFGGFSSHNWNIYIYQFNVAYYININISGLLLIYSNNVHAPTFYASYVDSEKILMIAARWAGAILLFTWSVEMPMMDKIKIKSNFVSRCPYNYLFFLFYVSYSPAWRFFCF